MSVIDFFKVLFSRVGFFGVSILQFLFTQHIFWIIGFIAFASTIWEGVSLAILQYDGFRLIALHSVLNIAKIILFVDNQIYLLSRQFYVIANPSFLDVLKYFYLILKNLYFYLWWYWLFGKLQMNAGKTLGSDTNKSTGMIDLFFEIMPKYLIFFTIMNFIGLFATGVLSIAMPQNLTAIQKIPYFFNSNFGSAFDLIFKLFPFKGIAHFLIFSLGKMLTITFAISKQTQATVNETWTKETL